jgi:hypothetical protein
MREESSGSLLMASSPRLRLSSLKSGFNQGNAVTPELRSADKSSVVFIVCEERNVETACFTDTDIEVHLYTP